DLVDVRDEHYVAHRLRRGRDVVSGQPDAVVRQQKIPQAAAASRGTHLTLPAQADPRTCMAMGSNSARPSGEYHCAAAGKLMRSSLLPTQRSSRLATLASSGRTIVMTSGTTAWIAPSTSIIRISFWISSRTMRPWASSTRVALEGRSGR